MLMLTFISMSTGYVSEFLNSIANIYSGYTIIFIGSIIGFIDAFIGLYLLVWIYNKLSTEKDNLKEYTETQE